MKNKKNKKNFNFHPGSHAVIVRDVILHAEMETVRDIIWRCSVPECENSGKTPEMFSLDPLPSGFRRPLENAVLCEKCARRMSRMKIGRRQYAAVYHLLEVIEWLRQQVKEKVAN